MHHYISEKNNQEYNQNQLQSMFLLRKQVFKDRLNWEVSSNNGMEIDYFDKLNPAYLLYTNENKQVEGCCRVLPTTGPNMLKDIFPQLLRGEELPVDKNIWEVSRFAVQPKTELQHRKGNINIITVDVLRQMYDFAVENNISNYVAVTSAAMARILQLVGIPIRRFGDEKLTRVGKVLSVCIWLDINEQYRQAVYSSYDMNRRKAA